MSIVDKSKPDVLRVTEYVLEKGKRKEQFSVCEAAKTSELNGIDEYRIAEILRDICLQPNGPNSMDNLTHISNEYLHNQSGNWQLTATTYFSYLAYLSVKEAELANRIAVKALGVAIAAIIISIITAVVVA